MFWCETSSLALREKRKLRVFENRVLRRIFGTKMDEVTGGWRKLTLSILLTTYYSGVQIEHNEMGGHVSTYGGEERSIQGFGGET